MKKLFLSLLLVLSLISPAWGAVIFSDNFDAQADWNCGGTLPTGWSGQSGGVSALYQGTTHYNAEIKTPGRGGTGKCLRCWQADTLWDEQTFSVLDYTIGGSHNDLYTRWYMKLSSSMDYGCTGDIPYKKFWRYNYAPNGGVYNTIAFNIISWTDWSGRRLNLTTGNATYYLGDASWFPADDAWHCYELRLKLNTNGNSDGIVEFWLDGNLKITKNDCNWDAITGSVFTGTSLGTGNEGDGSYWQSSWQAFEFDDYVVSTTYIGTNLIPDYPDKTLQPHTTNPRYFMDRDGNLVYLTGSHTWGNWVDPGSGPFNFSNFLNFLGSYGHNYFRLWTAETTEYSPYRYNMSGDDFDLTSINQTVLNRLRTRVEAARCWPYVTCSSTATPKMYVGINLFRPDHAVKTDDWAIHHFNSANNVNSINGDTNSDGKGYETYDITPEITAITNIQKTWIRAVVDTVNDLDNVLYEIGNEGDWTSAGWQYAMIDYLKAYELTKDKQHPVIMSAVYDWLVGTGAIDDSLLMSSNAEAVGFGLAAYGGSPAVAAGTKVSILDNDHFFESTVAPKGQWPWRTFMRGHNPVLMDWYTSGDPSYCTVAEQEDMRKNMGYTRTYANKIDLAHMIPQASGTGTPSSTNYCLYYTNNQYLFYQPTSNTAFTIAVPTQNYAFEWFNITTGQVGQSGSKVFSSGSVTAPFSGPAVLWLKTAIPTEDPVVTTIDVTLFPTYILDTETSQATAIVYDQFGAIMTGQIIVWSSSATGVATINSATGLITGVAAGTTTITATIGSVTGTEDLLVQTSGAGGTEVLVGNSTNYAVGPNLTWNTWAYSMPFTATWTGPLSTVSCTIGKMYLITSSGSGSANGKMLVYDGSGNLISTSAALSLTADAWNTFTFPAFNVTKGNSYRLGFVYSSSTLVLKLAANGSGIYPQYKYKIDAYTSPPNPWQGGYIYNGTYATISAYLEGATGEAETVDSVVVSISPSTLNIGQQVQATAVAKDASGNILTGKIFTWASSDPTKATIGASTGVINAIAAGTADITATCETVDSAAVTVTVNETQLPASIANGGFENGDPPTSWSKLWGGETLAQTNAQNHSGTYAMQVTIQSGAPPNGIFQTITGLSVGSKYRVTAWFRGNDLAGGNFSIGVYGMLDSATAAISNGSWTQLQGDFIATATSHTINLYVSQFAGNAGKIFYLDDVSMALVPATNPTGMVGSGGGFTLGVGTGIHIP